MLTSTFVDFSEILFLVSFHECYDVYYELGAHTRKGTSTFGGVPVPSLMELKY
jgi:hypothetical protein